MRKRSQFLSSPYIHSLARAVLFHCKIPHVGNVWTEQVFHLFTYVIKLVQFLPRCVMRVPNCLWFQLNFDLYAFSILG